VSMGEPIASHESGLRGIIAIKAFYGILFFLIGLGVFALINKDISDLAEKAADSLGIDPENGNFNAFLEWLTGISPKQIAAVGLGTILYSGLYLTMAWGLHLRQAWAEWLTIVATGLFIPVEIYEVVRSWRLTYVLVLVINASIVWYLLRRRARLSAVPIRVEASLPDDVTTPPTLRS
jgi:uncharacterized membrane protein (DUF2068 family)